MFELKDFIKKAITDISLAVTEAQKELAGKGVKVNPRIRMLKDAGAHIVVAGNDYAVSLIDFDIAITAAKTRGANGGLSIAVMMASLTAGGSIEKRDSNVSRIRFQVPLDIRHDISEARKTRHTPQETVTSDENESHGPQEHTRQVLS